MEKTLTPMVMDVSISDVVDAAVAVVNFYRQTFPGIVKEDEGRMEELVKALEEASLVITV